jgi:outer membrane murein-binding lipoprotein Lpp
MKRKNIAGLIAIAAIVVVAMLAGCVEKEQVNTAEIKEMILASVDQIDTYKFDIDMTQKMLIQNETTETEMTTVSTGEAAMDVTNKKMMMEMAMTMETPDKPEMTEEPMEMDMFIYLIDNAMYMKMDTGIPELPAQWTKMEMPDEYEKTWESQNQVDQQMELLNISAVELLEDETVNGVDCYVLKITPDMDKYGELLSKQEGMSDLMQSLQQNDSFDMGKMIKEMSMKQWIAKNTKFPMKTEMQIKMVISSEDMIIPEAEEEFTMTSDQRTTIVFSGYNKPVAIELPEDAERATGFSMPSPMDEAAGNATESPMLPPMNETEPLATA